MEESLKEKTAKGLFWGGMNNVFQQIIGLIFGIILGRLLSPSDYGMIAMITIFTLVANAIQDSGFKAALTNLENPRNEDYNSVFWFNFTAAISMYVILFFCAPLIADFYHTEEIVPLARYAFLAFVFASFATAPSAYLFKHLQAKQQAKAAITAILVSCPTGAILAYLGFGYWALATQNLTFVFVNALMSWYYSPWHPNLHVDYRPALKMFRFSCKILATNIVERINSSILNVLLGHYFSKHSTGIYNQAYQWETKCHYLVQGMLVQVTQPMLVDLKNEQERQMNALRKLIRFTSFISFPLLFGFGLVAKEFIVLTITDKWIESAQLLQLLCISGAILPLITIFSNLIISKGKSGLYFWITISLGIAQIILMITLYPYGIRNMVIAYVIINIIWLFVWHFFIKQLTGYKIFMLIKDVLPFAIAAFAVMVAVHFITLSIDNLTLLLTLRIILAATLYYLVMKAARVQILKECQDFIVSKIKKR